MSRKPVNKLRTDESRDAIWALIREVKGEFTLRSIQQETHLGRDTVNTYLTGLVNAGYLKVTHANGGFTPTLYLLIKDIGVDAPRVRKDGTEVTQGQGRLQMWNTIRVLRDFSSRDLAFNASTDLCKVTESDAKHYIYYLHAAGYLVRTRISSPTAQARYRLVGLKWTGPKPPQIQRVRQVYDPNTKQVAWTEGIDAGGEE